MIQLGGKGGKKGAFIFEVAILRKFERVRRSERGALNDSAGGRGVSERGLRVPTLCQWSGPLTCAGRVFDVFSTCFERVLNVFSTCFERVLNVF